MRGALRLAAVRFRRSPGHYLLSAAILGLGTGAAATIFSAVDAALIEPLPFPEADRLVEIRSERGGEEALVSMREVGDLEVGMASMLDGIAAYIPGGQYSLAADAGPEKPPAILMTQNLFEVLGVGPSLGGLWPDSYDRERNFGLVLSHELWSRQFGARPDAVGGTVSLDASPYYAPTYEIYGVMPEGFDFPARTDLYRSLFINDAFPGLEDREDRVVVAIARLSVGVSIDEARGAADRVATELAALSPESNGGVTFELRPIRASWVEAIRPYLLVLLGAALILLVTACANVANLVLTRVLSRESEMGLRTALGAGRGRLLAGLAVEGLVLAALGGAAAIAFASFAIQWIDPASLGLPSWMVFDIDGTVLLFTAGTCVLTGIAVGLWPARAGLATDVMRLLRQGSRGPGGGTSQRRLRESLISVEVALSLALLLGSALFARTFISLGQVDPGLETENLLTMQVPLPWSYPTTERVVFQEEVLQRVRQLPGVVAAATNANPPLTTVGQPDREVLEVEGQPATARLENPYMNIQRVSPGYFETTEIPLLEGRVFDVTVDRDSTRLAAIVSERLADQLWPGESAVGRRIRRVADGAPWWEVVGVVGDVRYEGLSGEGGFDVYLSSLQAVDGWAYLMVRTQGDPLALEVPIKETIWSIDAGQPVVDVRPMADRVADTIGAQRLAARLFAFFAVVSLALAGAGIFAVVSVLVRQRTSELGVRAALGADSAHLFRGVLTDTLMPTLIGVGLGLMGGLAIAWSVRGFLFGVEPWDPITVMATSLGIVAVALVAAAGPALRAARLDPVVAFRQRDS
ncbi:MAG: ADOP family duplicated permease [Gemmatimonadota bacterium]